MSRKRKKVYEMKEILPQSQEIITWKEEREEELKLKQQVKARTKNQEKLIHSILTNIITFATGVSGTGKTFVSCGVLAQLLLEKKIDGIVITRPAVEIGNNGSGWFPGSPVEKTLPYVLPILDALGAFLGDKTVDKLIKEEVIDIKPLGLMRGNSFKSKGLLIDESQNLTYLEAKTLLTRIDVGSKMILAGDLDQSDIYMGESKLKEVMDKLQDLTDEIGFIEFTIDDVQRSGIVKKILQRL